MSNREVSSEPRQTLPISEHAPELAQRYFARAKRREVVLIEHWICRCRRQRQPRRLRHFVERGKTRAEHVARFRRLRRRIVGGNERDGAIVPALGVLQRRERL